MEFASDAESDAFEVLWKSRKTMGRVCERQDFILNVVHADLALETAFDSFIKEVS